MNKLYKHLKNYLVKGLLAVVPLILTFVVLRLLYSFINSWFCVYIDGIIGYRIPGLGILILIILLYITGIIVNNFIGKKIFNFIERISIKIPFVKLTYQVGKQVSNSFSVPDKKVFKQPVLIEYLKEGQWVIGFVTGFIIDKKNENEKLLKVFVPTPPVPTSGFLVLVRESEVRNPGWTIEEALKAVISGGIIGPDEIT